MPIPTLPLFKIATLFNSVAGFPAVPDTNVFKNISPLLPLPDKRIDAPVPVLS